LVSGYSPTQSFPNDIGAENNQRHSNNGLALPSLVEASWIWLQLRSRVRGYHAGSFDLDQDPFLTRTPTPVFVRTEVLLGHPVDMSLCAVESNLLDTATDYCNIERITRVSNGQSDLRIPTHMPTLLALEGVDQDKFPL